MRGGCFYTCVCSSSTCAIGAGWGGASASLATIFAFVFVGNVCLHVCGLALIWARFLVVAFGSVAKVAGFFPHVRDFRASFGGLCMPGDI